MYDFFLIVKQPCGIVIFLSKVYLRIISNHLVLISNDILCMIGGDKLSLLAENCSLFLNYSARFIRSFYFDDLCKLFKSPGFKYIYDELVPDVDYSTESFNISNKHNLDFCMKMFTK